MLQELISIQKFEFNYDAIKNLEEAELIAEMGKSSISLPSAIDYKEVVFEIDFLDIEIPDNIRIYFFNLVNENSPYFSLIKDNSLPSKWKKRRIDMAKDFSVKFKDLQPGKLINRINFSFTHSTSFSLKIFRNQQN